MLMTSRTPVIHPLHIPSPLTEILLASRYNVPIQISDRPSVLGVPTTITSLHTTGVRTQPACSSELIGAGSSQIRNYVKKSVLTSTGLAGVLLQPIQMVTALHGSTLRRQPYKQIARCRGCCYLDPKFITLEGVSIISSLVIPVHMPS